MQNAKFLSLNKFDAVKGLVATMLGAIIKAFIDLAVALLSSGILPDLNGLKIIAIKATSAGLVVLGAYLAKNFLTNSKDQFLKPEPIQE